MHVINKIVFKSFLFVFLLSILSSDLNLSFVNYRAKDTDPYAKECTIFTCNFKDKVFFCGNLDHPNREGFLRFWPASEEGFGGLLHGYQAKIENQTWIGYEGGLNEKGLAFDTNGLPDASLNPHPEKEISWDGSNFWYLLLKQCATVEEAIDMAMNFNFGNQMNFQVHVADATGDAVIISPGADGEIQFTRKKREGNYLISTNFNVANPEHRHEPYPCPRFETSEKMLKEIHDSKELSTPFLRSILDAVHFEGASYNTIYSYINDLNEGIMYLYYFHQFDEVVVLNLATELESGNRNVMIRDLVSEKTRAQADAEYASYKQD